MTSVRRNSKSQRKRNEASTSRRKKRQEDYQRELNKENKGKKEQNKIRKKNKEKSEPILPNLAGVGTGIQNAHTRGKKTM